VHRDAGDKRVAPHAVDVARGDRQHPAELFLHARNTVKLARRDKPSARRTHRC